MPTHLASWNEGASRSAIVDFVTRVTTENGPGYVPPAERIATFDNDGTLWLEKPMPIQLAHGLQAIGKAAAEKPELRERQPFKAVYEKDMAWLSNAAAGIAKGDLSGIRTLLGGMGETFNGIPAGEFQADALDFLNNAQDTRFKRPYKLLAFKPMVELVDFLQANGFQVYITSGGGRDFMRVISEEIYGIPRSMVIGSSVTFKYGEDSDGNVTILRTMELEQPIDNGPDKPVHIHRTVGRPPIMAAGNSDGDIEMLKYAGGPGGKGLSLLVHHDDGAREYAYDSASEKALQLAPGAGWVVVSMKNDWKTVFD